VQFNRHCVIMSGVKAGLSSTLETRGFATTVAEY
jgi:hypothetical protein